MYGKRRASATGAAVDAVPLVIYLKYYSTWFFTAGGYGAMLIGLYLDLRVVRAYYEERCLRIGFHLHQVVLLFRFVSPHFLNASLQYFCSDFEMLQWMQMVYCTFGRHQRRQKQGQKPNGIPT